MLHLSQYSDRNGIDVDLELDGAEVGDFFTYQCDGEGNTVPQTKRVLGDYLEFLVSSFDSKMVQTPGFDTRRQWTFCLTITHSLCHWNLNVEYRTISQIHAERLKAAGFGAIKGMRKVRSSLEKPIGNEIQSWWSFHVNPLPECLV